MELLLYLGSLKNTDCVFHGSPHKIEVLVPQQAFFDGDAPELNQLGIYATDYSPIALLYSVIHEDKNEWGLQMDPINHPEEIIVVAPDPLKGGSGYLYVLPGSTFKFIGTSLNCVAYEPVTPIEVLEVHPTILEDLQRECGLKIYLPETD